MVLVDAEWWVCEVFDVWVQKFILSALFLNFLVIWECFFGILSCSSWENFVLYGVGKCRADMIIDNILFFDVFWNSVVRGRLLMLMEIVWVYRGVGFVIWANRYGIGYWVIWVDNEMESVHTSLIWMVSLVGDECAK